MELIVISSPVPVVEESMLLNNLFIAGLQCLHIRKPGADVKSVRGLINGIAPRFYHRLVLHQFHEIAADYGINRLHYTEQYRAATSAESRSVLKAKNYVLSTSIHDLTTLPLLQDFDYTFYGPVFNSLSKPGYESVVPAHFKLEKSDSPIQVFAIGGVTLSGLAKIKTMNFDGAAVLGAIWNEPHDAVSAFVQLKQHLLA